MEKKEKKILRKVINFSTKNKLNNVLMEKVARLEEKSYEKQLEKETKKVQEKTEKVKGEKRNALKEAFSNFSLKNSLRSEVIEEEDNGFWYFRNENRTEGYEVLPTTLKNLADSNKKPFEKELRGQELLKRNLKASPLYILDGDNIIKVENIQRVYDYDDNNNKEMAYVMLETKYQDFVIEYNIICTF